VQETKKASSIDSKEFERVKEWLKEEHSYKNSIPIESTEFGIVRDWSKEEQYFRKESPIEVTVLGMIIDWLKEMQLSKNAFPIEVTEFGIVRGWLKFLQARKKLSPIEFKLNSVPNANPVNVFFTNVVPFIVISKWDALELQSLLNSTAFGTSIFVPSFKVISPKPCMTEGFEQLVVKKAKGRTPPTIAGIVNRLNSFVIFDAFILLCLYHKKKKNKLFVYYILRI
jgi:hypothetical protein